ncbi:MAG: DUF2062 domain-containing protein [Nitrospira sp.]|nr:DUF2062 domain-containing protein [Nitrospira sp.]
MASFRAHLKQVLHLQESPKRTATAFAIGTAIAFCPFYGFHTLLAIGCTWGFRLNFIAIMAGNLINNPWTLIPILGATYWTGALLLGQTETPSFDWHDLSFSGIYEQVLPYAIPFALGGIVLSLIGSLLAYPTACYFISKYRRVGSSPDHAPLPPRDRLS